MDKRTVERVSQIIPRLASDSDGEIVATVRAIRRTLESSGHDLYDLTAELLGAAQTEEPETDDRMPGHQRDAEAALRSGLYRDEKERAFLRSMSKWNAEPTGRQRKWLDDILSRGEL